MRRTTVLPRVFLILVLIFAGCDGEPEVDTAPTPGAGVEEGSDPGVEVPPVEPPISLPNGTNLAIPPGALAEDVDVFVSQPAAAEFGPSVLTAVVLEHQSVTSLSFVALAGSPYYIVVDCVEGDEMFFSISVGCS